MKLRTPIGFIAQVRPGYLLQSTEDHALSFSTTDDVRQFMALHAEQLPFDVECIA